MTSNFQNNDIQMQHCIDQRKPTESTRIPASSSFTADEKPCQSHSPKVAHDIYDSDDTEHNKDDKEMSNVGGKHRGHKRGLSIKGSCRRQWLRNQSKIEKTKRKDDIMKDSIPVPEDAEAVETGVGETDVVADDVRSKKKDTDNDLCLDRDTSQERIKSMSESKSSPQNQGPTTVKATVEF